MHTHALIEVHRSIVSCPDVEGDIMTADRLCIALDELKQGASDVLAASGFVHANIINIQCLAITEQAVVFYLSDLTERVALHSSVIVHKDRI